jgi:anti-sigma factor RsiW
MTPAHPEPHPEALLLPWYVRGGLAAGERAAVEAHLAGCAACRAELEADRVLAADHAVQLERFGDAPPSAHAAVMRQIRAEAAPARNNPFAWLAEAARTVLSPRWAPAAVLGLVAVQAGLLVVVLAARTPAPQVTVRALAPEVPRVEITFRADAPLAQAAAALDELGGRIVAGPRSDGTVTVELGGADAAGRLARLRGRTELVVRIEAAND